MRKRLIDPDIAAEQGAAKREALAELGGRMDAADRAVAAFARARELRQLTGPVRPGRTDRDGKHLWGLTDCKLLPHRIGVDANPARRPPPYFGGSSMQPGDLVQLVSGGPVMALAHWTDSLLEGGPGWFCVWAIQGAVRKDVFPVPILAPYDPENPLPSGLGRPGAA